MELVKPIFGGRRRRRKVTVYYIQVHFDYAARFPFQEQESNRPPILLFFHFSTVHGHTRFHTR